MIIEEKFFSLLIRCRKTTDNSIGRLYYVSRNLFSNANARERLSPRLSSYSLFLSVLADDPKAPDIPPRVRFTFRHNDNRPVESPLIEWAIFPSTFCSHDLTFTLNIFFFISI